MKPLSHDSLLGRLARRAVSADAPIRPRLPSRFEALAAHATERTESWGEGVQDPAPQAQALIRRDAAAPQGRQDPPTRLGEPAQVPRDQPHSPLHVPSPLAAEGLAQAITKRAPATRHADTLDSAVARLIAPFDVPQALPAPSVGPPSRLTMPSHEATTDESTLQTSATPAVQLRHQTLVPLVSTEPRQALPSPLAPGEPAPHRAHATLPTAPDAQPTAQGALATAAPVEITIGRIDIRGVDEDARPPARAATSSRSPSMPLADYLRRRDERRS